MNARSHKWFEDAKAAGMKVTAAYLGTTVIDSWEDFWQHTISEKNLSDMMAFGLEFPEAASHRWSIMSGPRPWSPQEDEKKELKRDPRFSALDLLTGQKK